MSVSDQLEQMARELREIVELSSATGAGLGSFDRAWVDDCVERITRTLGRLADYIEQLERSVGDTTGY